MFILTRILLIFCVSFITNAADSIALQRVSYSKLSKSFVIHLKQAQLYPQAHDINSLNFVKERIDQSQIKHTHLQQYYLGIPILGGSAILHKKNDSIQQITGRVYQELNKDLGDKLPYTEQLTKDILQEFTDFWPAKNIVEQKISPIIFIDKSSFAHWAYQVELTILTNNSLPQKPSAIIDANTKSQLISWDNIKTSRTLVKGLGFGGNQKIGLVQYGHDLPFLNISHDEFFDTCYMENKEVKVVDMQKHYTSNNLPMFFNCPNSSQENIYWTGYDANGYDKINGAYSISNDALYIAEIIKTMYKKIYNIEPLVENGQPQKLIMRVHYGKNYANAFWDGTQMSFGDGDYSLYPLVSLSIGAHEITHGFTEQHSNLVYFGQSGAINESFSDMAAQAAEYYLYKKNNWKIGHEVVKDTSPMAAIRFLNHPSLDKHSIEFAHHYRDDMDVHYSSGVYNKLFYLIATTPNWDTQKAFKVMLKANVDYWTPTATFSDAACGIINAARDLKYSITDIKNALEEVIIDYDDCYKLIAK